MRIPCPTELLSALWIPLAMLPAWAWMEAAQGQITQRVSLSSAAAEGNGLSFSPAISSTGRWVTFSSAASNLVANDTNGVSDVFVRDRQSDQTIRVSVASNGAQGNSDSNGSDISADGRFVVFASTASNLVPNDTNGMTDVFLRDLQTGQTSRVSVTTGGAQANGHSHTAVISDDGRFVAFQSAASNLVPGDTNLVFDVFVRDLAAGETSRVSVSSSGAQSNGDSIFASISADGRYVSFTSQANTLETPPGNFLTDVFVRDRQLGTTIGVSVTPGGGLATANSAASSISADGRFVAFSSDAGDLVADDGSPNEDVFLRDLQTGITTLVSRSTSGAQADNWCFWPSISGDGRYVSFVSDATNLAAGDTNGKRDVFRRGVQTGETIRVSVSTAGAQGNNNSGFFSGPAASGDGSVIAFESFAANLVPGDANATDDIFVRTQPPPCVPGDVDCDGHVDVDDLFAVINGWGACAGCPADIDGNGVVDVDDLFIVINAWS